MLLAVSIVLGGFVLLYFVVSSEERHLHKADRSQKR